MSFWSHNLASLQDLGLSFVYALAIFLLGLKLSRPLSRFIKKALTQKGVDETIAQFSAGLVRALLISAACISAIAQLGVETASFMALIGSAGLAIGLSLQGALSHFAAAIMLLIFRPFKKGDFIETNDVSGKVESISLFNTILKTPDNKVIVLPNAQVANNKLVNFSAEATRRVAWKMSIGYQDDLKKAKEVLLAILHQDARIHADPAPFVAVEELAESSVNFVVRAWVKREDYWDVFHEVLEAMKVALDAEKISIPYKQIDLHVKEMPH